LVPQNIQRYQVSCVFHFSVYYLSVSYVFVRYLLISILFNKKIYYVKFCRITAIALLYQNYRAMELPFYLSFNEFESHYYDNLEKWFEEYHNTSETDYLQALADMYSPYLYYSFTDDRIMADASMEIKDCFFPYYDKIGLSFCTPCENGKTPKPIKGMNHIFEWKTITMMEYAQHVLDKINRYISKNKNSIETGSIHDYINDRGIITSREGAGYCVNYTRHQTAVPFLKAYLPHYGQTVNIAVYRDFIFSAAQIAEYIDSKLSSVQAFEHTIYAKLKSEAKFRVQMSHQFLTICN